jgi:hypothetical protein
LEIKWETIERGEIWEIKRETIERGVIWENIEGDDRGMSDFGKIESVGILPGIFSPNRDDS